MSERYSRLYSLPENLYAYGAPVIIAAGALLKDNQTGKVLVQLKLKNIAEKAIKAARVSIFPFDTIGNPLGADVEYQYLDLNVIRDGEFGSKTPVPLPDAATRQFSVAVTEVAFSDNTLWTSACITWEPLPKLELLDTAFRDKELIKQYRIEYGVVGQYVSTTHKDLWFCACGAINREQENDCHRCRKTRFVLQNLDLTKLQENCNERLAAEAKKAAEEKAAVIANKKRMTKAATIVLSLVVVLALLVVTVIIPNRKYTDAVLLMESGNTAQAAMEFASINYKDSAERSKRLWNDIAVRNTISAGYFHCVGLQSDGTVVVAGDVAYDDVSDWTDIVSVSAGKEHTVGLKSDGTVVASGRLLSHHNVSDWTDIVAVSAGYGFTVGLKSDGTVVATGNNDSGQCNVSDWTDIVAVFANYDFTVGLKSDGTVVATDCSEYDPYNELSYWTDIVAVFAVVDYHVIIGLKSDGTMVETGYDISEPTDIVAVSGCASHLVGLQSDGTVVDGQCDVSDWTDIVAVSAGSDFTVGLKSDGTVLITDCGCDGKYDDISKWSNIKLPKG